MHILRDPGISDIKEQTFLTHFKLELQAGSPGLPDTHDRLYGMGHQICTQIYPKNPVVVDRKPSQHIPGFQVETFSYTGYFAFLYFLIFPGKWVFNNILDFVSTIILS